MIGTPDTRLVILRGNSGSGKSSVARALQKRRERSQLAVVSQDVVRRDAEMLTGLVRDHQGRNRAYFWDLPFEETVRRHQTKGTASEFGEENMREWWYGAARIAGLDEESIGPEWRLDATVRRMEEDCCWL